MLPTELRYYSTLMKRLILFFLLLLAANTFAQKVDELDNYNEPPSRLRGVIEKYREDYGILNRFYSARESLNRQARFKQLNADWLALLDRQNFDALNHDEQVDFVLFKNYLDHEQHELARYDKQIEEMSLLIPFAKTISDLEDSRRKLEPIDSAKIAALLNDLNKYIVQTQKAIDEGKIVNRNAPLPIVPLKRLRL